MPEFQLLGKPGAQVYTGCKCYQAVENNKPGGVRMITYGAFKIQATKVV